MLIYPADRIVEIQEAKKFGINAEIKNIDFNFNMERMRERITHTRNMMLVSVAQTKNLDYYEGEGQFITDYTVKVNDETVKAPKIVIASGSRPIIPPIKGLDEVKYLTNESLLQLTTRPDSLIIIGGGYVSVEYAHFFAAMGTKVTILEMADRLVLSEEPEIAALLQKELGRRVDIFLNTVVESVSHDGIGVLVKARDISSGENKDFISQRVMIAVGRRSNADLLKVESTGVAINARGFIKVDEHMETTKKNIYAIGDADGQQMFTHVANREAQVVGNNVLHEGEKSSMDYTTAPHAIFSYPQIASVGITESEARNKYEILVGKAQYSGTARGEAMGEIEGFAKAIVDKNSGKILGFHIIGPEASTLIHEVINAIAYNGHMDNIFAGMHIHPAMPELVQMALTSLE
jgi:mycothione reductase